MTQNPFRLTRSTLSTDVTGANHCGLDPWVIVHDKCQFIDSQSIKLQEAPDMVPVGELPRHMILQAERYLTGQVVPGSRMIATGIYSTYAPSGKNVSCLRFFARTILIDGVKIEIKRRSSCLASTVLANPWLGTRHFDIRRPRWIQVVFARRGRRILQVEPK